MEEDGWNGLAMTIWLYCICRNEAKILPYFLRHYVTFVDKLVFLDGKSDDGTRELIAGCPKSEIRDWPGRDELNDNEFLEFANNCWQEADGKTDWVIFVDADEFVYHPRLLEIMEGYLRDGVEVPQINGFTMISDHFPTTSGQIYDEIKTGIYDCCWSKCAVFRNRITWNVGRHSVNFDKCKPRLSGTAEIKLLHYRCLGMDYLKWRHRRNWERVPGNCRAQSFGVNCEPGHQGHHGVDWFASINPTSLPNVI